MSTKPLPKVKEAFSEVRQEESRKKVMMGSSTLSSHQESSALAARGQFQGTNQEHRQQKGRPWCDHCRKAGHFKETCWKLHGKPADWKSKSWKDKESHGNVVVTSAEAKTDGSDSSPFNKAQLEALQKLLSQSHISSHANTAMNGNHPVALFVNKRPNTWILDSGASDHMTGNANIFSDFQSYTADEHHSVKIADGTSSNVKGLGSIRLNKNLTLDSVLYVPKLNCNLLSISKFTRDLNCETKFYPNMCVFQDLDSGKMIGSAKMCSGLYILQDDISSAIKSQKFSLFSSNNHPVSNKDSDIMLWHYRLGHPNFMYLSKMFPSLFINKSPNTFSCEICQFAKHTRSCYSRLPYKSSKPFSFIHSDVWGPSRINTMNGQRWFVSFIDDHTRLTWVFLMKSKSEVSEIFKKFHSMIQTQFHTNIQILKTDNAKDYFNYVLASYLTQKGVIHLSSCVDTPQQNGIAERKNRHLLEVAHSPMFSTKVSKYF